MTASPGQVDPRAQRRPQPAGAAEPWPGATELTLPQIDLVFPPFWTLLEAPPPGPAMLRAALARAGQPCRCHDLNILLLHELARPEALAELDGFCRQALDELGRGSLALPARVLHGRLLWSLAVLDELRNAAPSPLQRLREPGVLEDVPALTLARRQVGRLQAMLHYLLRKELRRLPHQPSLEEHLLPAVSAPPADPVSRHICRWTEDLLQRERTDLLGLTVHAPEQLPAALQIARHARSCRPDLLVVLGGAWITQERRLLARCDRLLDLIDAFVLFEGETALVGLARSLTTSSGRQHWSELPNLLYRPAPGAPPRRTALRSEELARLPLPDHTDAPWELYLSPARGAYVEATRGCYHGRCAYCADRFAHPGHRRRDVRQVAAWIEQLAAAQRVEAILFTDEALPADLLASLCGLLRRAPAWGGEVRPEQAFDQALLRKMADTGCRRLQVGVETLSDRLLSQMRRGVTGADVRDFLERAADVGIPLELFVIDGLPTETDAEREATCDGLAALLLPAGSWVACSPFYLDRRSTIARRPRDFGVQLLDPPYDGPEQHPLYLLSGEPPEPVHEGRRALPAPLVATPGEEPGWPVAGHLALLWADRLRNGSAGGAPLTGPWRPRLEVLAPDVPRSPRGEPLPPAERCPPAAPGQVLRLAPELRLVYTHGDPVQARDDLRRRDQARRQAVSRGADRRGACAAAAAEQASGVRPSSDRPRPFLLDLKTDCWLYLDPAQAATLALADGSRSVAALAAELSSYSPDPPQQVLEQLCRMLGWLLELGVVQLSIRATEQAPPSSTP